MDINPIKQPIWTDRYEAKPMQIAERIGASKPSGRQPNATDNGSRQPVGRAPANKVQREPAKSEPAGKSDRKAKANKRRGEEVVQGAVGLMLAMLPGAALLTAEASAIVGTTGGGDKKSGTASDSENDGLESAGQGEDKSGGAGLDEVAKINAKAQASVSLSPEQKESARDQEVRSDSGSDGRIQAKADQAVANLRDRTERDQASGLDGRIHPKVDQSEPTLRGQTETNQAASAVLRRKDSKLEHLPPPSATNLPTDQTHAAKQKPAQPATNPTLLARRAMASTQQSGIGSNGDGVLTYAFKNQNADSSVGVKLTRLTQRPGSGEAKIIPNDLLAARIMDNAPPGPPLDRLHLVDSRSHDDHPSRHQARPDDQDDLDEGGT